MFGSKIDIIKYQVEIIDKRLSDFQFNSFPQLGKSYSESLEDIKKQLVEIEQLLLNLEKVPEENIYYAGFINTVANKIERVYSRMNYEMDLDWLYTTMAISQNETYPMYYQIKELLRIVQNDFLIVPVVCSSFQSFYIAQRASHRHFVCLPYSLGENPLFYPILFHEVGHIYLEEQNEFTIFKDTQNLLEEKGKKILFEINRRHGDSAIQLKRNWDDYNTYWELWRKELFCDGYAFHIAGPSYLLCMWEYLFPKDPFDTPASHPPLDVRIQYLIDLCQKLGYKDEFVKAIQKKWDLCIQNGNYRPGVQFQTLMDDQNHFEKICNDIFEELHNDESWHYDVDGFNSIYSHFLSEGLTELNNEGNIVEKINFVWILIFLSKMMFNEATNRIVKDLY